MLSIFTPTHKTQFLGQAYDSLREQTDSDFQWVVLYNNGAEPVGFNDPRVKEITKFKPTNDGYVGELKAIACQHCDGDILMELDHDDLLLPTAVEECKSAFEDESVGFVYSNDLVCNSDWTPRQRYNLANGWQYRQTEYKGRLIDEPITFAPEPAAVSRIWFAPDHFRSFRKSVYEKVGGYDPKMRVLDDGDLLCRLYLETRFRHIDRGLYVYRVHGDNAWLQRNKEIQDNVMRIYHGYIERMANKWARDGGLRSIELGGGMHPTKGYETVDIRNADICCDLDGDWPFPDSSVGVIRAADVFEHLRDPIHTMMEAYRVLAPGGWIFAQVPSTTGKGAFQDPTHRSYWNSNSWLYFTHQKWAKYIGSPVRFQLVYERETEPDAIGVTWTQAHLLSLKNGYVPPGEIFI